MTDQQSRADTVMARIEPGCWVLCKSRYSITLSRHAKKVLKKTDKTILIEDFEKVWGTDKVKTIQRRIKPFDVIAIFSPSEGDEAQRVAEENAVIRKDHEEKSRELSSKLYRELSDKLDALYGEHKV